MKQILYSRKVWRGESLANLANCLRFAKLKPSKLIVTIDNPMADLFIRQTFFCQTFENSRFAKHSARQTFPLYGIPSMQKFSKIKVTIIIIRCVLQLNQNKTWRKVALHNPCDLNDVHQLECWTCELMLLMHT